MRYKAIAVDIDGTIMNHGKEMISPLLYKTFLTCKEKGLKLVVVTSRSLKEMELIHQELLDLFDYKVYSTGVLYLIKTHVFVSIH